MPMCDFYMHIVDNFTATQPSEFCLALPRHFNSKRLLRPGGFQRKNSFNKQFGSIFVLDFSYLVASEKIRNILRHSNCMHSAACPFPVLKPPLKNAHQMPFLQFSATITPKLCSDSPASFPRVRQLLNGFPLHDYHVCSRGNRL